MRFLSRKVLLIFQLKKIKLFHINIDINFCKMFVSLLFNSEFSLM